ncbi:MAG: helix-turn-helix transcriptional regulator, partial [Acidobacteria bacterium]|nr:helix-turn-helix transcriptional regulator [Acidobacteriota bacterium]
MIARIEKGQIPTLPTLQKIAQALDSSITITGNKVSIVANNISQAA